MRTRRDAGWASVLLAVPFLALSPATTGAQATADSTRIVRIPHGREVDLVIPEYNLVIGGLIQAQAEAGDRGDDRYTSGHDRFYLRRARLNASGRVRRYFDFKLELEVAGSLAEASGLRAQATDVYGEWTRYPLLWIRAGQFKTPFGFEQLYSDPRMFTIERSLANDRMTLGRQSGVQLSGRLPEGTLSWSGGLFNGTGTGTSANDNDNFLYVARIAGKPLGNRRPLEWSLAANGYVSHDEALAQPPIFGFDSTPGSPNDNIFRGRRRGIGADTQFQLVRFDFWLEYFRAFYEPDDDIPLDFVKAEGGYAQVATFIVPGKFQAVVRHDVFRPNLEEDLVSRSWYFGLNGLIAGDAVKLQLGHLLTRLAPAGETEGRTLARLQVVF